jgi:hypothetical protein
MLLHRAALQRVDRAGHRQVGLAGAGRADAEGDVVRGHVLQVARLVGRAPAHLAAARLHGQASSPPGGRAVSPASMSCTFSARDGLLRHLVQRLQHLQRLLGLGLGAFDAELLEAVRDLDLQRRLDAADVAVHRPAQVGHAGVVGRGEGVAEDQNDNPGLIGGKGIPQ